jgi:hypothetical protein
LVIETTIITMTPTSVAARATSPSLEVGEPGPALRVSPGVICISLASTA